MAHTEKPWVLLVDDNEATCTLITAILLKDFTVETAGDGGEAIEKLKTKQYAAILLDLRMPHTDGFAVLEFLKHNAPERLRTVLVVTATLAQGDLARARAYGVHDIVSKPFEVEALHAAVKQCASRGGDGGTFGTVIYSSTPVILLLADLLKQRLL